MDDLQYLNKNKNMVTKNIRYADQRILELKSILETLQTQKYLLTKNKNDVLLEIEEYEQKLYNINPWYEEFIKGLRQSTLYLIVCLEQDDEEECEESIRNSRSNISMKSINEVRNQIRNDKNLAQTVFKESADEDSKAEEFERKPSIEVDLEEDK